MEPPRNAPVLSFASIVQGRDSSVRVTDDGLGDIIDVVMVVTGKDCNHANACFRSLSPSLFDNQKLVIRNGRRYASLRDIITLIMVLPGKIAKEIRSQFAEIIENYIRDNFSSDGGSSPEQVGFKRRREELELLKLEEEIKGMAQSRVITLQDKLEQIRDPHGTKLDDRTRLMFQDTYMNMLMNSQVSTEKGAAQAMLTNGPSSNAPISIGSVAAELGYKPSTTDGKRIGIDLKKRYVKLHGRPPSKHDQLCDGRVTQVNSYSQKDRPILVEALRAYFSPPDSLSSGRSDDSD